MAAFAEDLETDRRALRLTLQLVAAATQWCARGATCNPVVALERAGLSDRVGDPLVDARPIAYLAELATQLGPLATTPAALRWAAAIGVEPWLVLGLLRREGSRYRPREPCRCPGKSSGASTDGAWRSWCSRCRCSDATLQYGPKSYPDRVQLDWPVLWYLRDLVPHPIALDPDDACAFIDACASEEPVVPVSNCLLEGLWQELRAFDDAAAIFLDRPVRVSPGNTMRHRLTDRLDAYPRGTWAAAILTAAVYWIRYPDRIVNDLAAAVRVELTGATDEPSPPVFRLLLSDAQARWQRVLDLLGRLATNHYANAVRAVLQLPPDSAVSTVCRPAEGCARPILFEAVLREAYGAVIATVCDPLAAMECTRARAERLLGPLDRPLGC